MTTVRLASSDVFELAEGPAWDAERGRLLWVDILGHVVLEGRLADGQITVTARHSFDGTVGAVAVGDNGSLLVAAQTGLVIVGPDGARADGSRIIPVGAARRLNDGAVDPAGRFVVGTLSLGGPSETEELVRAEPDGRVTVIDSDLTLSNGVAWSVDGTRMYSVDTLRQTVYVRDYDAATGAVGHREVHLVVDQGHPDGIAVDAQDHLWVALWGAGAAQRYAPDGTPVERIEVPAPHTSCIAFAGDDLRTLVITTATQDLTATQRRDFPDSGRLFTAPVDVPGTPTALWRSSY